MGGLGPLLWSKSHLHCPNAIITGAVSDFLFIPWLITPISAPIISLTERFRPEGGEERKENGRRLITILLILFQQER